MDQLVRIWSNEKKMVVTQCFNSWFIGGAKTEKTLQYYVSLNFLQKKGKQKNSHHWYKLQLVVYILYMAAWKLGLKILIGILGKFLKQLGSY